MFVKAIRKIEETMFPILRVDQVAENLVSMSVVGTGFFIGPNGRFITVAHVFDNALPSTRYFFWGFLPTHLINPPTPIVEIARDNVNDIYCGSTQFDNKSFLDLSNLSQETGKSVCIAGYPLAVISSNPQGGFELSGVRRYFQPSFVLDTNYRLSVNDNSINRIHDGFLVRDVGLFGMSGGPVFDRNGLVVGMQGSVTAPRTSTNGSRTITVENAMVIRSNLILPFLKQHGCEISLWERGKHEVRRWFGA